MAVGINNIAHIAVVFAQTVIGSAGIEHFLRISIKLVDHYYFVGRIFEFSQTHGLKSFGAHYICIYNKTVPAVAIAAAGYNSIGTAGAAAAAQISCPTGIAHFAKIEFVDRLPRIMPVVITASVISGHQTILKIVAVKLMYHADLPHVG